MSTLPPVKAFDPAAIRRAARAMAVLFNQSAHAGELDWETVDTVLAIVRSAVPGGVQVVPGRIGDLPEQPPATLLVERMGNHVGWGFGENASGDGGLSDLPPTVSAMLGPIAEFIALHVADDSPDSGRLVELCDQARMALVNDGLPPAVVMTLGMVSGYTMKFGAVNGASVRAFVVADNPGDAMRRAYRMAQEQGYPDQDVRIDAQGPRQVPDPRSPEITLQPGETVRDPLPRLEQMAPADEGPGAVDGVDYAALAASHLLQALGYAQASTLSATARASIDDCLRGLLAEQPDLLNRAAVVRDDEEYPARVEPDADNGMAP